MKVQDILTDESKWTKGTLWRDATGRYVGSRDTAVCFCLQGAIYLAYPDYYPVIRRVQDYLQMKLGDWNDTPVRTFAEVRGLIEELDI